ncbi:hypothetical protein AB8O38_21390, partial [Saccharomonospora xinjiangensis]|uniref:hypothetical protein n=1 Tax=Saccharomonospora xinjiangensis TaxID=75294 RepID=UPI00350F35B7
MTSHHLRNNTERPQQPHQRDLNREQSRLRKTRIVDRTSRQPPSKTTPPNTGHPTRNGIHTSIRASAGVGVGIGVGVG